MKFFRASVAVGVDLPMYFIESTARDNIDDPAVPPPTSDVLKPIEDSDIAVKLIAQTLANGKNPNLVVMVHGFNNPYPAVLETYTAAALAINGDDKIRADDGLVCVGYRWPSEKMGTPWRGTWDAMPTLPTWLFYAGTALAVLPFLLFCLVSHYLKSQSIQLSHDVIGWISFVVHLLTLAGLTLAGLVLTAALLRAIVYFRDTYRATNYGAPDLVQIIRAIDGELGNLRGRGKKNDVELSFIGHSMGGFVVTNTIRVLSDVFARPVTALNSYGADLYPDDEANPTRNIGDAFVLKRFVLASPDIPAETLLSNRGNFLASAIARFEEAYLFSSEGDEVLRQISTLANYFVFPTKSRNNGFRLGNVEILSSGFGLIPLKPDQDFLAMLRVGNKTVRQLSDALRETAAPSQGLPTRPKPPLPTIFSYFDCTDYRDQDNAKDGPRGLLTFALDRKRNNPDARLSWYSHLHLLYAYLTKLKPNVHGGYFEGLLSQQLIYRLACLGFDGTVGAYGGPDELWDTCKQKQIRVLVSPLLEVHRDQVAGPIAPGVPASDGTAMPPI
jgi:pimeloyl-ACP methyl ester carboxylesterase